MIEVYLKDLSPRVQEEIRKWGYVDRDVLNNKVPVTTILFQDVESFEIGADIMGDMIECGLINDEGVIG